MTATHAFDSTFTHSSNCSSLLIFIFQPVLLFSGDCCGGIDDSHAILIGIIMVNVIISFYLFWAFFRGCEIKSCEFFGW